MARRKTLKEMTAEEREEYKRHIDETLDLVEERIAYHRARADEEREQRERAARRRAELAELGFFRRLVRRLAA